MATVPGQLIWEIVKKNNSFLVKDFGNGTQSVVFSKESNNLYNLNSYKHSGLANSKTVTIQPGGKDQFVLLATTSTKKQSKPASLLNKSLMKKEFSRMAKAVSNQVADNYYRPDLKKAALARLSAVNRSLKVAKSGVKKRNRKAKRIPGRKPSYDPEPSQGTATKSSQPNAQASKSLPRIIARLKSSLSGQNGKSIYLDGIRWANVPHSTARPRFDREPSRGTATKSSQPNVEASNPPPRVIVRPRSSPSGQNGQAEPKVEMSEEDAVCTFCYCILNVGEDMFKRKCNCQRERDPVLAHEGCTNNNHQSNAPCSQCEEPFQNIPMTLHWAPKKKKLSFPKGCFSS